MSNLALLVLVFFVAGVGLVGFGLSGLLTNQMVIHGKFGGKTRYTGNKAVALALGFIVFGLSFIFIGVVVMGAPMPQTASLMRLGFIVGIGGFLLCWVLSWLVSGTAERERTHF